MTFLSQKRAIRRYGFFPLLGLLLMAVLAPATLRAQQDSEPRPDDWAAVEEAAKGQDVYLHAWAGSPLINAYIGWTAQEVAQRYDIHLHHVKIVDASEAVSRVVAEKAAGHDQGGAVDLIWINGENFAAMKSADLLYGPWTENTPNWKYLDLENKPLTHDFTIPTEGLELPWGMAQMVFIYNSARIANPPRSMAALLAWAKANPGRFTFPKPPDFLGTTFLKQALYGLIDDPAPLLEPIEDTNKFREISAPLWDFIEKLTPYLWRKGQAYPQNGPRQIQLMADDEIDLAVSFNPAQASAAIANQELPDTVRTFVPQGGSIGNASFLAIPYNANAKAGAMVVANFLISPEAQLRRLNPAIWGLDTVLALDKLDPEMKKRFEAQKRGIATLSPQELGIALPEPHPSWMNGIEVEWSKRFERAR